MFVYKFEDSENTNNFVWVESDGPFTETEDYCYDVADTSFEDNYGYIPSSYDVKAE